MNAASPLSPFFLALRTLLKIKLSLMFYKYSGGFIETEEVFRGDLQTRTKGRLFYR